jgi:hypothetical protein
MRAAQMAARQPETHHLETHQPRPRQAETHQPTARQPETYQPGAHQPEASQLVGGAAAAAGVSLGGLMTAGPLRYRSFRHRTTSLRRVGACHSPQPDHWAGAPRSRA